MLGNRFYTPFQMHVLVRCQMAENGKQKRKGWAPKDILFIAPTVAGMYEEGPGLKASQRRGGRLQKPRFYRED